MHQNMLMHLFTCYRNIFVFEGLDVISQMQSFSLGCSFFYTVILVLRAKG